MAINKMDLYFTVRSCAALNVVDIDETHVIICSMGKI